MFNTAHIHPMVVHFPIALIMTGFLAEVVSLFFSKEKCLSKTGLYLMVLGAISAIVAWSSGQLFTNDPTQGAIVEVFEKHESAALVTMLLISSGALFRIYLAVGKKEETSLKWVSFALYGLAFASVIYTGFLGGTMVFDYMMAL
jgi:uncharacterized membrane protein